jgi:hypothetical protein
MRLCFSQDSADVVGGVYKKACPTADTRLPVNTSSNLAARADGDVDDSPVVQQLISYSCV